MKKTTSLWIGLMLTLILLAVPLASASAIDTMPPPIDPQSWQMNRDRTWDDFVKNPVIDWMSSDFNPEGLMNSKALQEIAPNAFNRDPADVQTHIRGAVILVDFIDKPFITSQPLGSDLFGFGLSTGKAPGFESTITKNPVRNNPDRDTLAAWWADYLNEKLLGADGNNGSSFNEFYRENTYGKWGVDLIGFGPYTLNGLELQYGGLSSNERPPSLRFSGSLLSEATAAARAGADGKAPWNPDDFDFFFVIHSGYDESGVWLNFGMMQWSAVTLAQAKTVVPDLYGPKTKLAELEELFTAHPEHVERLATKTTASSAALFHTEAAKIAALRAAGTLSTYEFKFPQSEWDWAASNGNAAGTRYVAWTAWAARISYWSGASSWSYTSAKYGNRSRSLRYSLQGENDGMATFAHEFGHISGIGDNYDNPYTLRNNPRTEPWELMSRGSFAGPFGDQARWTVPGIEGGSVPTNFMAFNKIASSSYDDGDVLTMTNQELAAGTPVVAEIVARNVPLNNRVVDGKKVYQWLEDRYGLVSPNYYKAIRLNFGSGAWADQAVRKTTGFSQFPATTTRMLVEVVQRTGYDSFAPDDGVIIARNNYVVDSHPYDIAMLEYSMKDGLAPGVDDVASYTLGSMAQLYDAAFHAGLSTTDTGYYRSEYDPADPNYAQEYARYYAGEGSLAWQKAMIKPGSLFQWEEQDGREIASGDTVNEWHDPYNKLHFYILEKHMNPGKYGYFLSYSIGVLHDDGVAVGGELEIELAEIEAEAPGRIAVVSYNITNTGSATDIIRTDVEGDLPGVQLNNLYAIGAGETITVSYYVEIPADACEMDLDDLVMEFTAASESNAAKVATDTVDIDDLVGPYNFKVWMKTDKDMYWEGETIYVDVMLKGNIPYTLAETKIKYDTSLLEYMGYENISGWMSQIYRENPNFVTTRNISNIDMNVGAPCLTPTRLVTLKFLVKEMPDWDISTKICFETINVYSTPQYPTPSVKPGKCVYFDLQKPIDPIKLHYSIISIDTHNDSMSRVLTNTLPARDPGLGISNAQLDLVKMREGGLDVAFFGAYTNDNASAPARPASTILSLLNALYWSESMNLPTFGIGRTPSDIVALYKAGKLTGVPAIEGAYSLKANNAIELVRQYKDVGVAYITLCWSTSNELGEGVNERYINNVASSGGLTALGAEVVREMNRLGIAVDVSHMNDRTFWGVVEHCKAPIFASHSNCWGVYVHARNLKDEQMLAIAESGGVVQQNFYAGYLGPSGQQRLKELVDHIEYAINLIGEDHVGLGSDFDGGGMPSDLPNASYYYRITEEMVARGYRSGTIKKIMGENTLRVIQEIQDYAEEPAGTGTAVQVTADFPMGAAFASWMPHLSAVVAGDVEEDSIRVIVDGLDRGWTYDSATGALVAYMNDYPLTEMYHIVTFEAANKTGKVTRDTKIFYVTGAPAARKVEYYLYDSELYLTYYVDNGAPTIEITDAVSTVNPYLTLVGWNTAPDGGGAAWDFTTPVTADLKLYANWFDRLARYNAAWEAYSYYFIHDPVTYWPWDFKYDLPELQIYTPESILAGEAIIRQYGVPHAAILTKYGLFDDRRFTYDVSDADILEGAIILEDALPAMKAVWVLK